jgi:hypothetical protein
MSRQLFVDRSKPNGVKEKIACGTLFISVISDTDGKIRFFFNVSKGGCEANLRAIASLLTKLYNDRRIDNRSVIDDSKDIDCKNMMRWKGRLVEQGKQQDLTHYGNSCANVIARVLEILEIKEDKK